MGQADLDDVQGLAVNDTSWSLQCTKNLFMALRKGMVLFQGNGTQAMKFTGGNVVEIMNML